jgi:hypothetical protein
MTILVITGPSQSGKTLIANALRNDQISKGKGALLVDEETQGDVEPLLEKIIKGKVLAQLSPTEEQQLASPDRFELEKAADTLDEEGNVTAEGQYLTRPLVAATDIPWKEDALIILVGGREADLDAFEERIPGLKEHLGPLLRIETSQAA